MRKKILLVSLMLILVVAGLVGGVMHAQAAPSSQTTGVQRLFGMGQRWGNGYATWNGPSAFLRQPIRY